MKKIGIITVYNACNYGSFLQAYALQETIKSLGEYEVGFVPIPVDKDKVVGKNIFSDQYVEYETEKYQRLIENQKLFSVYSKKEELECAVIGSDTIWNLFDSTYERIPYFLGKETGAAKVVSYAASVGQQRVLKILFYKWIKLLPIRKLNKISVRDDKTEFIVKTLGKMSTRVLDPTFLYDFPRMQPQVEVPEKYMLVYTYGFSKEEIDCIVSFARNKKLKIIATGSLCDWADYNFAVDSFEWLWLVYNAEYIVTNTFHGTVFSIKYRKQFVSLINKSDKIVSLLKELKLSDRIVNLDNFERVVEKEIPYEKINSVIEQKRENSLDFLKDVLKDE